MKSTEKRKIHNEIYIKHKQYLYKYAYFISGSKEEAEDLMQETFVRAWNGLDNLKDLAKVKAWLKTILRREYIRMQIKKKDDLNTSFQEIDYLMVSDYNLELKNELDDVLFLINSLEEEYREALILQTIYGYKISEISKILNLNENTISTRIFRARNQLKNLQSKNIRKDRDIPKISYEV